MKHYEAGSTIRATPEVILEILTDGPSYAAWDNGVVRVEGRIVPGETIKVVSEANPDRTFPVKVSGWRPGQSMEWSGGMPLGLFRGFGRSRCVRTGPARPTSRCARSTPARCSA